MASHTESRSLQGKWAHLGSNQGRVPAGKKAEQEVRADKLDLASVGALLVSLVETSRHLRHKLPRYTARDYLHPIGDEEEFVVDVMSDTPTDELIRKWFE